VVLSLALPGAAAAQPFSVPAHLRKPVSPTNRGVASAGPALAGDRVLWWETRAGTTVLVSARAGEAPHDLVALPPVPTNGIRATLLTVAASEVTAIAERITADCPRSGGDCRVVADQTLKVDPATGAAAPFDTCLGAPACARCVAQGSPAFFDLADVGCTGCAPRSRSRRPAAEARPPRA
jgi:hypothetical protein